MRKYFLLPLALFCLFLVSCGPTAEELKREQEIEDSIAKVEREEALNKAVHLLEMADSLEADSLLRDSLAKDSI